MGIVVRPPAREEMPRVGQLAAALVRQHHAFDPERFFLVEPLEEGYARYLGGMLDETDAVVLVAHDADTGILGYAFASLEPRDWNRLLDAHGHLHDIYVDEGARRRGVAELLVTETIARLRALGATRVVLDTAQSNEPARSFFARLGFRPTMVEMMLPLDGTPPTRSG
jgi:ribosomal protein S18 acetylase RimI-like enzyme